MSEFDFSKELSQLDIEHAREQYYDYIDEHKNNVAIACNLLLNDIPEIFDGVDIDKLEKNIYHHDESKYSTQEFDAYANYFFGGKRTDEIKKEFDYAWLHHSNSNMHHWNYWVLNDTDGQKVLDMPKEYIIEMICDWMSFGIKNNDPSDIINYYNNNKNKIILSDKTRKTVEEILEKIEEKLEDDWK